MTRMRIQTILTRQRKCLVPSNAKGDATSCWERGSRRRLTVSSVVLFELAFVFATHSHLFQLVAAANNAEKKQRLAGKNYVATNLARQIDFAEVARCGTGEDDRKQAGEQQKRDY
jgi:hypothetical protein